MQKKSVTAIFGPPGTGKTYALVDVVRDELKRTPNIVFLSFTRSAAAEALSRIDTDAVKVSTLHSLAFNLTGVNRASVIDRRKLAAFGRAAGITFRGMDDTTEVQEGDDYLATLQYARNTQIGPWEAYDHHGRPGQVDRFKMFLFSYAEWKKTYGYLDFDDMLEGLTKLPSKSVPTREVVILDEAQDCSRLQWGAFEVVTSKAQRVYVAGDDDQAVYQWSGANPHGMSEFTDKHSGSWRVLSKSYRLPRSVWEFSQSLLSRISKRTEKSFEPTADQGSVIRHGDVELLDWSKISESDVMFLVRDNYRLREIQKILHAERVPYTINGDHISPYENRWATAIRGVDRIRAGDEPTDGERDAMMTYGKPDVQRAASARKWADIKGKWKSALAMPPRLMLFYETADLYAPLRLRLSTIHQAKGQEEKNVVVDLTMSPRVEQGAYQDMDAELRVMYVAVTRAKQRLELCGDNLLI